MGKAAVITRLVAESKCSCSRVFTPSKRTPSKLSPIQVLTIVVRVPVLLLRESIGSDKAQANDIQRIDLPTCCKCVLKDVSFPLHEISRGGK